MHSFLPRQKSIVTRSVGALRVGQLGLWNPDPSHSRLLPPVYFQISLNLTVFLASCAHQTGFTWLKLLASFPQSVSIVQNFLSCILMEFLEINLPGNSRVELLHEWIRNVWSLPDDLPHRYSFFYSDIIIHCERVSNCLKWNLSNVFFFVEFYIIFFLNWNTSFILTYWLVLYIRLKRRRFC